VLTISGESAQTGGGARRSRRSQICPHAAQNVQNGEKTGVFTHFFAYKSPKMPFFIQKYVTRHFLRNTLMLKIVGYLKHCGIIPV
jgi:hypothetical protein